MSCFFYNYVDMPLPRITTSSPTLQDVWLYTYRVKRTRFDNMDRDILPSKIKVLNRLVYKKNKEGKLTTPDERLQIVSYSAPQYGEYLRQKGKNSKKQMKIKHHYDVTLALQKDEEGVFSFKSKLVWRVGSNKRWDSKPSQSKIKTVYADTKDRLIKKYTDKKTGKINRVEYNKAIDLIKKKGKYLSIGDYNSQEKGIMADFYFRIQPLCYTYDCLFGPLTQDKFHNDAGEFPFFDKHSLAVIMYLLKKRIIIP
jgi:hypothetical protein